MWEEGRRAAAVAAADCRCVAQIQVPMLSILWTRSQYALLDPTPSSVHLCALRAPPAPSILLLAKPSARCAQQARSIQTRALSLWYPASSAPLVERVQLLVPTTATCAAAAAPARSPTCPVSRSASRALTPAHASSPAPSFPTATAATPQSATRIAALSAATLPMAAPCASERLRALTLPAVASTAALQPTFSTSAPLAHPHS